MTVGLHHENAVTFNQAVQVIQIINGILQHTQLQNLQIQPSSNTLCHVASMGHFRHLLSTDDAVTELQGQIRLAHVLPEILYGNHTCKGLRPKDKDTLFILQAGITAPGASDS